MAGITLAGSVFNAKKLRTGFLLWGVTNIWWIVHNFLIGEYAQSVVYVANLCISIYGFICWGKKEPKHTPIMIFKKPKTNLIKHILLTICFMYVKIKNAAYRFCGKVQGGTLWLKRN
jgi:hypothetical protein